VIVWEADKEEDLNLQHNVIPENAISRRDN
jgi:hypothetical protein